MNNNFLCSLKKYLSLYAFAVTSSKKTTVTTTWCCIPFWMGLVSNQSARLQTMGTAAAAAAAARTTRCSTNQNPHSSLVRAAATTVRLLLGLCGRHCNEKGGQQQWQERMLLQGADCGLLLLLLLLVAFGIVPAVAHAMLYIYIYFAIYFTQHKFICGCNSNACHHTLCPCCCLYSCPCPL